MRILYVASAIEVPGSYGGATHVTEVASGLAKLGHTVRVIARRSGGARHVDGDGYSIDRVRLPQQAALFAYPQIARIARDFRPEAIIERYYNFAGAGMIYAHRHRIPALLEVNAAMLDPKGALKTRLDTTLFLNRLRWWAETQGKWAARIVTPLNTTVPPAVPRDKIVELPWGANVALFDPARPDLNRDAVMALRAKLGIPANNRVIAFVGSFRRWHGVNDLIKAAAPLLAARPDTTLLLLGSGPLFDEIKESVTVRSRSTQIVMTGALPYAQMPLYLRLADVGVAPFNTAYHPALRENGFYWSPLKLFEYMAMGLPVVTTDIPPLNTIIRPGETGALFRESSIADLTAQLEYMLDLPEAARRDMGERARQEVIKKYSWAVHCREIAAVLHQMVGAPSEEALHVGHAG